MSIFQDDVGIQLLPLFANIDLFEKEFPWRNRMHLISIKDWSQSELVNVVEESIDIKNHPKKYTSAMSGLSLALLFQKTSTRTRCAGEVGMTQLGGHALFMDWRATNFALADLGDEIRVLASYVDLIMVRFLKHDDVRCAAEASSVPVINGCCDRYHPTQALADLMTIQEQFGRTEGIKLTYVGVHNNVANSLIAIGMKVGMEVTVVAPEMNPSAIDNELFEEARQKGCYKVTDQLKETVATSDVVYTDTWVDMEYFLDPAFEAQKQKRMEQMQPYQLNESLLEGTKARIMHCLPAHRGAEISGELVDDERSIIFQQSENRLHCMKGLMLKLISQQ
jgi:ornithine carbamoyltransferase